MKCDNCEAMQNMSYIEHQTCEECAEEHEQIEEWLEELKLLRENSCQQCDYGECHEYHEKSLLDFFSTKEISIRNKAIDDFAERLCYKIKSEIDDCADELQWIDEIAEQLKAGARE